MPYFRYKIVILQWFKTYSFKIMIRRIILTMAFWASLSLSAKDVNMGSWSREVVWADGLPLHEVAELREVDVKSLM